MEYELHVDGGNQYAGKVAVTRHRQECSTEMRVFVVSDTAKSTLRTCQTRYLPRRYPTKPFSMFK
eukprot:2600063-Rhodomonas_salina.1